MNNSECFRKSKLFFSDRAVREQDALVNMDQFPSAVMV